MPNNDSHQHVVKTSEQWNDRIVEFWVVPRGCLCVELTPKGKTKIKIGEGNKYYSQLPYICDGHDLSQYYTKDEIDNLFDNLNRMAIMSTDEYDAKSDLPMNDNKLGDVRFVKSSSPSIKTDPDIYLWDGSKWVFVGYEFKDIDLSQYLKKDEFHEMFDPVKEQVDEMYPMRHTHENKDILDQITAPYTIPEKEKLAGLENYDDTEIRQLIHDTGHTHPNKDILDTITSESLWSESDREKFDSLHNYDDSEVKVRIGILESESHTHDNKDILDQITAPFTTEDKTKLDSLHNDDVFRGTDGMYPGSEGNVPAPSVLDIGKFLSSDGTWKSVGSDVDFIGATSITDGYHGLVPTPMAGEETYFLKGDGTWAQIKQGGNKYKAGDGIYILSGETAVDSFPFNIYSTTNSLEEYIIYGSANGVGDWDSNLQKYVITIAVSSEGKQTLNHHIHLDSQLFEGDYIVYSQGIFVHYKTNLINDNESLDNSGIDEDGVLHMNQPSSWFETRLSAIYEVSDEKSYLVEYDKVYPDPDWYGYYLWNINLYDASMNITRTIRCRYTPAPFSITPTSSEKYIRVSYPNESDAQSYHYHFYILGENAEPISGLPRINIYANAVNTINVITTNKPSEIYVKVSEDEGGGTTPGSDFTGIIYNDGVLDVTQEDPNALNELTVHLRESTKVLTIPDNTYTLQPATTSTLGGIIVGDGLDIDANGVLSIDGSSTGEYEAGDAIRFTKRTPETLPAEYQLVDYIQSTGEQGIELNYIPSSSYIKYELTFSDIVFVNTDFHYLIGGYASAVDMRPPSIAYNFSIWPNTVGVPCGRNDAITNGELPSDTTIPHTYTLTVSNGSISLQLDNGVVRTGSYSGDISQKVGLFCSPSNTAGDPSAIFQTAAYRFRELKIYEGDNSSNLTLIHHYHPCYRISDDEPGIYDVITDTFLTNIGTGDLIIGPITSTPVINVQHGEGLEVDVNNDLNVKLGIGLTFDANDAIELDDMIKIKLNCNNEPD